MVEMTGTHVRRHETLCSIWLYGKEGEHGLALQNRAHLIMALSLLSAGRCNLA